MIHFYPFLKEQASPSSPGFCVADTTAEVPTTLPEGSIVYAKDTNKLWTASGQGYEWSQGGGGASLPAGLIVMWSGLLSTVPSGWALCDGTLGTPDLRDRFIYGWTAGVDPGGTGGVTTHGHSDHASLTHSGSAVANHVVTQPAGHSAHVVTQPGAHTNHVFTQPSAHTDHAASATGAASAGAQKIGTTNSTVTLATHTHTTPAYTHSAHAGGAVDAHSAHSGAGVDAHSAHSGAGVDAHGVTQPSAHATQSHVATDSRPPYFKLAFLMKT